LLVGVFSLGIVLGLAQAAVAQQAPVAIDPVTEHNSIKTFTLVTFSSLAPGASQTQAKPDGEKEKDTAKPEKPGTEGLKVHGHWKLVAKNPDGTVAKTIEFENSLQLGGYGYGDYLLPSLMIGQVTPGQWGIVLQGSGFCANSCSILTSTAATNPLDLFCSSTELCFPGMTTTITPGTITPLSPALLTFAGFFTATSSGSITSVQTEDSFCSASAAQSAQNGTAPYTPVVINLTPQTCQTAPAPATYLFNSYGFTRTGTSFNFSAGQLIQVSVTISFS